VIIVPLRFRKSAEAYKKIWTAQGSPLLINSQQIAQAVAEELGDNYQVELAMRYGNPSIESALAKLDNCSSIKIIPLFPQYSSAATGSALAKVLKSISKRWNIPEITVVRDFYDNPGFIKAYADIIQKKIANKKIDKILFSYHGLPERHIHKSACRAKCDRINACPAMNDDNQFCYRAQCYATSALLAQELNLTSQQFTVCFQSRLGRTPWIKPYTDLVMPELLQQGSKNIAVVCPSFVADCLETLEEINIRGREQWRSLGGEEFVFVPCINTHPAWVNALMEIVKN
jgi:ferrochelatase